MDVLAKGCKKEANMEQALAAIGFGKFHIWITITSGFIIYAVNSECWSIGYVIPSAECDLNLSLQQKTILVTVGAVGITTTQFLWGYLSDKLGRRNIMLYTMAVAFLCTMLSSIAPMFWLVVLFRFLNGAFIASAAGLSFAYVGEFFAAEFRSKAIFVMSYFIGIVLIMIPYLAWIIIPYDFTGQIFGAPLASWRVFMFASGIPSLVAVIFLYFSPESPKYLIEMQKNDEALEIIKKMHQTNYAKNACNLFPFERISGDSDSCEKKKENRSIWDLFRRKYIISTLLVCTIQGGVFATSGGLFLWYPDILQKISKTPGQQTMCQALNAPQIVEISRNATEIIIDTSTCGMIMDNSVYTQNMLIGAAYSLGYIMNSIIVNKVSVKHMIVVYMGSAGLATVSLQFVTNPMAIDILFLILLVLSGISVVVVNAAVVEIYPTNRRGMAVCLTMLSGRLSTIITSSLVGYLLLWNCEVTFILFAVSLIGCSLLAFLLPNK